MQVHGRIIFIGNSRKGIVMNWYYGLLRKLMEKEEGQGLVEYSLILVLIAIVVFVMVKGLGGTVNNTYNTINSSMP